MRRRRPQPGSGCKKTCVHQCFDAGNITLITITIIYFHVFLKRIYAKTHQTVRMPGFELEQVDGEGEPIALPGGDSVIGRGAFLHVSDKRVSRNHGILENKDGQLRLKPTHVNPCFVQTSLDAASEPLEKDRWHCLKDGEIFSLLPGKYIYRVRAVGEEGTPRNSQGLEEDKEETELNSKPPRSCEETLAYTPQAESGPSFTYESKTRDETHAAGRAACNQAGGDSLSSWKSNTPDLLTPRKKRVLPAWMMDATPAALNTSPAKAKRAPVRSTSSAKHPTGTKRPRLRVPSSSGDDEEGKGAEDDDDDDDEGCSKTPRKRARRLKSDTEESQDQDPPPKPSVDTQPEGKATKKADEEEPEKERAKGSQRPKTGGSTSSTESSGNVQTSVQQKAESRRRTACPYGASCYRKNPVHFQECSHPGDSDYEEERNSEDDEDDDRPECPYGTDCYRKNPLHKKEYKHTKPPAKNTAPVHDDDEDEDQYENSFINDDSEDEEDVDEDSDYAPESEDSEKEDIKRLQKEAKAFMKRKK